MTIPVLTAALTRLRADFDAAFPNRDRTSDGWIGDAAHQAEVSGHNPDDTPGVTAEYTDADTKPEVRAIDVDADLRTPGVTMYDVMQRILATPADLARLRYIIFCPPSGPFGANVPTIWSKSNGWAPRRYTGASPHNEHSHFSGDPLSDEDGSPWSVSGFGDDMSKAEVIDALDDQVPYTSQGVAKWASEHGWGPVSSRALLEYTLRVTQEQVPQLVADVAELKARPQVPAAPVDAAALKAVLLDPEVVAVYAKAAADLVHADLAD